MVASRVLIVEDERIVQMHLASIVEGLGHEVVGTAADRQEALAAAAAAPPDLALLDIHLDGGDDGVEVGRELRERFDCAIVFITAHSDPDTIARTGPVSAAGFLVKPFTAGDVRAAVYTGLNSHDRLNRAQQRERALASVLNSVDVGVLAVDRSGLIRFASPEACALTGWREDEAAGREVFDVLALSGAEDEARLRAALAPDAPLAEASLYLRIQSRNGDRRPVEVRLEPIRDQGRGSAGYVVTLRTAPELRAGDTSLAGPRAGGTRLLIYSHDTLGLGHLRRNLSIVRALSTRLPDLSTLLVTGSPVAHRFELPPNTDYLKLPAVQKVGSDSYAPRSLAMTDAGIQALRANLLLRTVQGYAPDILLADHSPTGMKGELLPALTWLREQGDCTRVLGLRDVIDEPARVIEHWKAHGIYEVLERDYDHVVVYGSREVCDPTREYAFPPALTAKTRFVHHVAAQSASPPADETEAPSAARRVVVTIGGGDGGADTVVRPFLTMLERFGEELDLDVEVVLGPLVAREDEQALRAVAHGLPVVVRTFVPDLVALYRTAQLVIATAGYNTCTELIAHARRAILIPRVLHRDEQRIRARRLAELGLVTCLEPDQVTPRRLRDEVERLLADRVAPLAAARARGVVSVDGAERFAELCAELTTPVATV